MGLLIQSVVDQVLGRTATANEMEEFLASRRARLTLNNVNGSSFNGQLLRTEMDVDNFGQKLHLSVKKIGDSLCITIDDQVSGKALIDTRINITDSVQKLSATVDSLELIIELDVAPSSAL